ncbi:hypothetical protein DERP_008548 [Dermatophagoides pteronyssinus]|uniref:Uncharacterized protein n=1 Tax=Dermatophagoides pteronyssinus TaxID=6956 RepID=A0ABQ8IWK6_DERPT|nr:hypothetical protein DERP_008548 [Dermatophagoides pteronyssinus]
MNRVKILIVLNSLSKNNGAKQDFIAIVKQCNDDSEEHASAIICIMDWHLLQTATTTTKMGKKEESILD